MTNEDSDCWRRPTAVVLGATAAAQKVNITGAGATFPDPIYEKWFSEYNKLHPDVQINYQPQGSGGGVADISQQTVFFGASDMPMTDDALAKAPGPHLPLPDGARRRGADLQHPRRHGGAEVHRRRCSPTSSSARSRSGMTRRSPPPTPASTLPATGHRRRSPLGRQRHDVHLDRLPLQGVAGVEDEGRRQRVGEWPTGLGGPRTTASPAWSSRRRAPSATSS